MKHNHRIKSLAAALTALCLLLASAFPALAAGSASDNQVSVAVFDGGFNPSDATIAPYVAGCYNAVTGEEGSSALSNVDHGTSCAGILINTASGICSAIGIPCNISLYLVQVDAEGSYSSYWASLEAGIEYAKSKGCRVVSISLSDTKYDAETEQIITEAACDTEGSILFAASGGNSGGSEYRYPASYANVLSVAPLSSTDSGYTISSSATHNDRIDLAVPGSTASAATPFAAGTAAALFQIDPSRTALGMMGIITDTASDAGAEGYDTSYGFGIINPQAAIDNLYYRISVGR